MERRNRLKTAEGKTSRLSAQSTTKKSKAQMRKEVSPWKQKGNEQKSGKGKRKKSIEKHQQNLY